ncbi:M14 family metallopeptidase [Oceanobacillus jeddahense]|uniref:M14 family metallopeptidase n=1 Tax=Oceanobacillus jeddahense TaxID=1462527 RepID=UPI00059596FE|nr:M14 family metallopeptidase [Oceanobacillus jeddahense]
MKDLRDMWEIGGLIEDQNKDKVADRVNIWCDLNGEIYPEGFIDFCARLGFETASLSFDFLQKNNRYSNQLSFVKDDEDTSVEWNRNHLLVHYQNEEEVSTLLRFLAGSWHRNFITGDTPVPKIKLNENKIIIELQDGGIQVAPVEPVNTAVSEKTYGVGSLTEIWNELGFMHDGKASPTNSHNIIFLTGDSLEHHSWIEIYYGASRIGMESTALRFPITGIELSNALKFHFQPDESKNASIQLDGNVIQFTGESKSLTNAISYFFREKHWAFGGHFGCWERQFKKSDNQDESLFQVTWEDEGERQELYNKIAEWNSSMKDKKDLDLNIFISESSVIRKGIKKDIVNTFPQARVSVRSAFKPGYFWLTEEVLPNLLEIRKQIGSVTINCLKEEREDGLELPIRWIQELYPVDEVMAQELQIDSSFIDFKLCETLDLDATYEVIVKDLHGHPLYKDHIVIPVSKVPYVEEGKYSYPVTASLSVYEGGSQTFQHFFLTDRERFYTFYTEDILSKLWEKADRSSENSGFLRPLFDRIEINVEMSEEELKLPVKEERISSLEALHEDLYFNTLDYFLIKGEQTVGKGYTAPGGIYPFIRVKEGVKPKAEITAYKWLDTTREPILTEQLLFTNEQRTPAEVKYRVGKERGLIKEEVSGHVHMEEIPEDLPRPMKANFHTWIADYSYRHKPIYVYEIFANTKESYYSAIKLTANKPTVLIETGHHANEVSSMPAVAELMDEITEQYSSILKNVNLVIIPRANPDGTELHNRMIADNPEWKHHAARYNAVGLEYSDVRYKDTIFGEGNVVPKIMNRWAPDVVIDNHGVPSHEWTQPFAGYHIPPRFHMSYWIPNSMIYGIARMLNEKRYPGHAVVLDRITHGIQQKVKQSSNIQDMNHYWRERYKKYGNQFMPKLFPIELMEELIFYKWTTETDASSTSAISRFPEWVSADLISEAADETVYGNALEICKEGQKRFNLGAIEWINNDLQEVHRNYDAEGIRVERSRPLKAAVDSN